MSSCESIEDDPTYILQCVLWQIEHGNKDELGDIDLNQLGQCNLFEEIKEVAFTAIKHRKEQIFRELLPYIQPRTKVLEHSGKNMLDKMLCSAVESGQAGIVRYLLNSGLDVHRQFYGKPLLHIAAVSGHIGVLEELLIGGAKIDTPDKRGDQVLHAVLTSQLHDKESVVKWLINKGANTHAKSSTGKYLVHLSAATSALVLDFLLRCGHDVNKRDEVNNDTPLHLACNMACRETITILIKHGCQFNLVNQHGYTPLAKLLRLTNGFNDFHSKTRVDLARKLMPIGFKMYPENQRISNKTKQLKGRDKTYDKYLHIMQTSVNLPSLQSLARYATRTSLTSGVGIQKHIDDWDIPLQLKSFLLFTDTTNILN